MNISKRVLGLTYDFLTLGYTNANDIIKELTKNNMTILTQEEVDWIFERVEQENQIRKGESHETI